MKKFIRKLAASEARKELKGYNMCQKQLSQYLNHLSINQHEHPERAAKGKINKVTRKI